MNQQVKTKWVSALRSGEYKKRVGSLKKPDRRSFCCLGVLCDLYKQEVGGKWVNGTFFGDNSHYGNDGTLPAEVSEWAGLDSGNPTISKLHADLIQLNDGDSLHGIKRHKFSQIADIIEAHL